MCTGVPSLRRELRADGRVIRRNITMQYQRRCFPRPLRKQEAGPLPGFKSEAAHCTHGAMTYQRVDARANAIIQVIWNV